MRILIVTVDYAAGPLASLTHQVAHALVRLAQREGHPVRVGSVVDSTTAHGSTTWVGGAAVTALHASVARAEPGAFAHWVQAQNADAIHCLAPTPQAIDLPWPQDRWPTVATLTGLCEEGSATHGAPPTWLRQARHRVCAAAAAQARWLACWPGLTFRVLPHGVDLLALLRKFAHVAEPARTTTEPKIASVQPLDLPIPVRWVPLHPVSLLGLETSVDAVVMPPPNKAGLSLIANECAALGLPCLEPSELSSWLTLWASGSAPTALQGICQPMPTRIEEEAFFYDCLYRL